MPIRVLNVQAGYYDKHGFHPLRRSVDYDPDRASDDYSSRRDSMGLRYKRKSKAKRAHTFVRGVAVNPWPRDAKVIPTSWAPAKVRRLKGGRVQVMIQNPQTRNIMAGFYDEEGIFHPIRASADYSRSRAGEKRKRKR